MNSNSVPSTLQPDDIPPPPPPTAASANTRASLASPVALVSAAALIGLLVAGGVGGAAGMLVYSVSESSCSTSDGWCDLGAVVYGMFAALVVATICYVVTGLILIFRRRPAGARARYVLGHLAIPVVLGVLLSLLSLADSL